MTNQHFFWVVRFALVTVSSICFAETTYNRTGRIKGDWDQYVDLREVGKVIQARREPGSGCPPKSVNKVNTLYNALAIIMKDRRCQKMGPIESIEVREGGLSRSVGGVRKPDQEKISPDAPDAKCPIRFTTQSENGLSAVAFGPVVIKFKDRTETVEITNGYDFQHFFGLTADAKRMDLPPEKIPDILIEDWLYGLDYGNYKAEGLYKKLGAKGICEKERETAAISPPAPDLSKCRYGSGVNTRFVYYNPDGTSHDGRSCKEVYGSRGPNLKNFIVTIPECPDTTVLNWMACRPANDQGAAKPFSTCSRERYFSESRGMTLKNQEDIGRRTQLGLSPVGSVVRSVGDIGVCVFGLDTGATHGMAVAGAVALPRAAELSVEGSSKGIVCPNPRAFEDDDCWSSKAVEDIIGLQPSGTQEETPKGTAIRSDGDA